MINKPGVNNKFRRQRRQYLRRTDLLFTIACLRLLLLVVLFAFEGRRVELSLEKQRQIEHIFSLMDLFLNPLLIFDGVLTRVDPNPLAAP